MIRLLLKGSIILALWVWGVTAGVIFPALGNDKYIANMPVWMIFVTFFSGLASAIAAAGLMGMFRTRS